MAGRVRNRERSGRKLMRVEDAIRRIGGGVILWSTPVPLTSHELMQMMMATQGGSPPVLETHPGWVQPPKPAVVMGRLVAVVMPCRMMNSRSGVMPGQVKQPKANLGRRNGSRSQKRNCPSNGRRC